MKLLIVIDMQNDFVTGCLGTPEARAIVPKVKKKIEEWQKDCWQGNYDKMLMFTRDTHGNDYLDTPEGKKLPIPHCIERTDGWKIVDGLEQPNCRYINKQTFGWNHWGMIGNQFKEIHICGVCSDICVVTNALILKTMYPGAEIIVDASCCAGTTPQAHRAAMEVMKSCQITVIGE